jgi:ACR3 family arsenite efflux pump ArsB
VVRRRSFGAGRDQQFLRTSCGDSIVFFGFQSGGALATVVGVLVEVPVMLSIVHLVRRSRGWYERRAVLSKAAPVT